MNTPLLTTKLYIPPLRQGIVSRPRLIDQLNAGLDRKLTLISAPAGFGKTTLLSEWIAALQLPPEACQRAGKSTQFLNQPSTIRNRVAWLSLDERDNDDRFWKYMIAALQTIVPGIGEMTLALLETPPVSSVFSTPPTPRLAEKLFAQVVGHTGTEIAMAPPSPILHEDRSGKDVRRKMGVEQVTQPDRIEVALTALINEIAAVRPDESSYPLILVLDDYHLIENPAIHAGMTFFLDHLPPSGGLHVVISARADPPLPLSRLRGRGQLNEMHMADLRFSPDEASAFLNQVMGLGLSAQDVAVLEARNEGWIVGLQMAALAISGRSSVFIDQVSPPASGHLPLTTTEFIRSFTRSDRYIVDYLTDEVLMQQPVDVQNFLLQTSILDRLCGPLCNAVCSEMTAQDMLERLEAANLFIVPLDGERKWFRYHHLFAELLHQRLDLRHPDLSPTLHLRASEWHAKEGFIDQAISHALAARAYERTAGLVQQQLGDAFGRGEFNLVLGWLEALPEELIRSRPMLCIAYAYSVLVSGPDSLKRADYWIEEARTALESWLPGTEVPGFDPDMYDTVSRHLATFRAITARGRSEPPEKIIELMRAALELVPESDPGTRSLLVTNLGIEYLNAGDEQAAERTLIEAARLGESGGFYYTALVATFALTIIARLHGHLRDVAAMCRSSVASMIEPIEQSGRRIPAGSFIYIVLGSVLVEWNDFSGAEHALIKGLESTRLLPEEETQVMGYLALARLKIAQDDVEGLPDLDDLIAKNKVWSSIAEMVRTRVWLMRSIREPHYLESALHWAEELPLEPENWEWEIKMQLTRARTFIFQSRGAPTTHGQPGLQPVLDFLDAQLRIVEEHGWVELMIDTLIAQALAFQVLGRDEEALRALERGLTLAEPEGYVRIFLDEGPPMKRLLYQAAQRGLCPAYAGKLLAAFDATPTTKAQEAPRTVRPAPLIEPLTTRETEVLRLLAEGLSNSEIAQRLFISISTVKRHNATIYSKLAVNTRTQAVAQGRELGLL